MPKMPTLGSPPKESGSGRVLLLLLCVATAAGGYWWRGKHDQARPKTPSQEASTAVPPPAVAAAPSTGAPADPNPPLAAPPAPAAEPGPRHVAVTVDGPLETALSLQAGREIGPALAQVVTRALVWWVNVPGDLRRGDKLDVIYEGGGAEEPQVDAVRLVSSKFGKTFEAYRFKPESEPYPRFYQPDGEELEKRLVSSPLDTYEQITSLIRDGRHHKGVDFKTPVDSPVHATFAGTITRKNWKWRLNGNCLELSESAAPHRKVFYLHLDGLPKSLLPGQTVAKGEVIARSGNSGHSFAPHLHYQLMSPDDRVLDPFESQETLRRRLPQGEMAALQAQIASWSALMGTRIATTGG